MWKLTPSFPSRDRNELTVALKPSAVDGTTINFSPFNWAVKPLGQDARNQARKALVSLTPVIKMGVLALQVVPAGVPLRGPDLSWDMRLVAVSLETADSDRFESMAEGLSVPLGRVGAADPAKTAAYDDPPSGGASCRLLLASCSSPVGGFAGMGVDPASGAGRLMAGSIESPEFANSLAFRLLAWRLGGAGMI